MAAKAANGKNQDLTRAPMYLVCSGVIYLPRRSLRNAGVNGELWTSTIGIDPTVACIFDFRNTIINLSNHNERIVGFPVRCIVRSGVIALDDNSLKFFAAYGYNWSQVPVEYSSAITAKAYFLHFNTSDTTSIYPSYTPGNRWIGYPVRCLVY